MSEQPAMRDQGVMTIDAMIEAAVEHAVQRVLGPYLRRIAAPEPVVYTVAQVAAMLQVSEDTVARMVKRAALPKLPGMGTKVLIPRRAVDELVSAAMVARDARSDKNCEPRPRLRTGGRSTAA